MGKARRSDRSVPEPSKAGDKAQAQRTKGMQSVAGDASRGPAQQGQVEQDLRAALGFSRAVIQRAAEGIFVCEPTGDLSAISISVWNERMTQITGYDMDQIQRVGFYRALFPEPALQRRVAGLWARLAAGHDLVDEEVSIVRHGGRHRVIRISTTAIDCSEGKRHVLVVVRDVTESKAQHLRILDYQRQLRDLACRLTVTEERLRRDLATQIHDEISQSLAMAKLQLEGLFQSAPERLRSRLMTVADCLDHALEKTRLLTANLSYPALKVLGLAKAIEKWLHEEIGAKYNLDTAFVEDRIAKPLDQDIQSVLFRSVREVLTNVVKHAKAKRVTVSIQTSQEGLSIVIEDDGKGFDPSEVIPKSTGFGILSIQESLGQLGGSIQVESSPGAGCRVTLTAPLALELAAEGPGRTQS